MSGLTAALDSVDQRLHGWLRNQPAPAPLSAVFRTCSTLGDGWLWLLGGLALACAPRPLAALGVAAAVALAVNVPIVALKSLVRRPRPGDYTLNPFLVLAVGGPPACDRYSFPSGHTANAVALATVLAGAFPSTTGAVFAVAVMVGGSRVVLGHHYLSDMLAGALVGLLAGGAVAAVRGFGF